MILLNSLALVLYDYNDRDSSLPWNQGLDYADYFFNGIFFLECVLKVIAYGLVMHRRAYLRIGWNLVDFSVVVTG